MPDENDYNHNDPQYTIWRKILNRLSQLVSGGGGSVTLTASDIEIGAVEIKNGTDDTRATVFDYTNSNPVATQLVDSNGDPVSVGGGTQYAEDTAATAGEQLSMAGVVRRDAASSLVDADGDRTELQVNATGSLRVDGSGVTQPISAASLPLPAGAATEATLATRAASAQLPAALVGGRLDVNVGAALPAGTNNIGDVDVLTVPAPLSTAGGGTEATALRVTLANDSTGLVSVDDNGGALTVDNGGTFAIQDSQKIADNAAFTDGTTPVQPAGYVFDETAGTALTENDAAAARIDSKRAQVIVIEDATTRGQRLAVSAAGVASAALKPQTAGGFTTFHLVSAASTNATNVKASAGQLFGWYIYNSNAAARKVAFHNTAGTPTAGASVFFSLVIPAGSGANVFNETGIAFGTGIAITTVTGLADSDSAAVAANDLVINLFYA